MTMEMIWNNNDTSTIKLRELLLLEPTFLDFMTFASDQQTQKFKKVFTAKFNEYEIGGETPTMFKQYLKDVYDENIDYFQQYINIYEDEINYLDGYISEENIRGNVVGNDTRERTRDLTTVETGTITDVITDAKSTNSGGTNEKYDLPHRQTNPDSREGYLSELSKTTLNGTVSSTINDNNTKNKNIVEGGSETIGDSHTKSENVVTTKKGGVNVVDQKFNYLKKLKNVYSEFAEKFKPCFVLIY